MTEIRIEHTDDSMSITVYKPHPIMPLILSSESPGIHPIHQEFFVRRYRRAERPSTNVQREIHEEWVRETMQADVDAIGHSYS